ncbi:MAG: helix-turn-helix domain-containing protein [Bacilli bacterium]
MTEESFGARIQRLRKDKALTQSDIGEKLGVTSQAVSKWENNQATPDIDILVKLSEIYEVSLDELLGKETVKTKLVEKPTKKDFDKMIFKIIITAANGDKVNVNLPMALLRVFVNKETGAINLMTGDNKSLEGIDFRQLLALVEQGVIGELVTIDSADGDQVRIVVE